MDNIFKHEKGNNQLSWDDIGDINEGRSTLGPEMPVSMYRLMQFSLYDVLLRKYGHIQADSVMREAGYLAGCVFTNEKLDTTLDLHSFLASLQEVLQKNKIGILRIEYIDPEVTNIVLTVAEDLDCSGLSDMGEAVCIYNEGFIAAILEIYTHKPFAVVEKDCWASGDSLCRFHCTAENN